MKSGQKAYSTVRLPKEKLCQKPKPPLPGLCARPISRPIAYPDTILGFLRAFRTRESLYRRSDHFLCQEVLRPPGRIHAICPGAHLKSELDLLAGKLQYRLETSDRAVHGLSGPVLKEVRVEHVRCVGLHQLDTRWPEILHGMVVSEDGAM